LKPLKTVGSGLIPAEISINSIIPRGCVVGVRVPFLPEVAVVTIQLRDFRDLRELRSR
jgi:hypothetical protein